jgi:hypothetical protein
LNLQENIAASQQGSMGYNFNVTLFSCTVENTEKTIYQVTPEEAESCLILNNARSMMVVYPIEEVLPHFRH